MTQTAINFLDLAHGIDVTTLDDMTDVSSGGGAKRGLLPAGIAFVVFSSYIEYGNQPQTFEGKAKDPQPEFRLGFHVVGGVGTNKDGELEDYVQDGFCPTINAFDCKMSTNEKARAVSYFNAINIAPKGTHFIQKLGTLYTVEIKIGKNKKTGKDQNEIDFRNLQPAVDAATRKPYTTYCNAADEVVPLGVVKPEDVKVFLWNKPPSVTIEQYQAMWDSIEIKGEYEVKDADGKVTGKKSKNFIQEKCLSALNFAGSSLEQLLSGGVMPPLDADEAEAADTQAKQEAVKAEVVEEPEAENEVALDVPDL